MVRGSSTSWEVKTVVKTQHKSFKYWLFPVVFIVMFVCFEIISKKSTKQNQTKEQINKHKKG
jgi:preprotein translocase subunit YajC